MIGIFLDTETNGLNPYKHRTIEIAIKAVNLLNGEIIDSYESTIFQPEEVWERSDPKSLEVNGFTWEMISDSKMEEDVAQEIINFFDKHKLRRKMACFICQNPSFDRVFFSQLIPPERQNRMGWPYHWLDLASMFFSLALKKSLYPWEIGLSKNAIAEHLNLPIEPIPHRAMNGVNHLLSCYSELVGFPKISK